MVAVADATPVAEFAPFEISSALTWTRQAATAQLDLAVDVVRRLPDVHAAMARGDIDLPKARVIRDAVAVLDTGLARRVTAAILPLAPTLTTGQLRARLARLVIDADPEAAAHRHEQRVRERRVVLQPTEDSCAHILGFDLPADKALAATARITAIARAVKQAGDPRSLDQLRADTYLDLLLGNATNSAHAGGGVELVATLDALAQLTHTSGHLNGYGPGHRRHRPPNRRATARHTVDLHHPRHHHRRHPHRHHPRPPHKQTNPDTLREQATPHPPHGQADPRTHHSRTAQRPQHRQADPATRRARADPGTRRGRALAVAPLTRSYGRERWRERRHWAPQPRARPAASKTTASDDSRKQRNSKRRHVSRADTASGDRFGDPAGGSPTPLSPGTSGHVIAPAAHPDAADQQPKQISTTPSPTKQADAPCAATSAHYADTTTGPSTKATGRYTKSAPASSSGAAHSASSTSSNPNRPSAAGI